MPRRLALSALLLSALPALANWPAPAEVRFIENGQPRFAVVTSATAHASSTLAARELAAMLSTLCGTNVALECGDGSRGLAVGAASEFPAFAAASGLDTNALLHCDDFRIFTHANGILLLGATPAAARHAVWDLLDRLGYRRFFAPAKWEILPDLKNAALALDAAESPSWLGRRIWYGWGTWPELKGSYADWCARNKTDSAFTLNTGHAYDNIRKRNQAILEAHPDYLGLLGGERKSTKFCISNPGLRKMVADMAVQSFRANPLQQTFSVDPSDGGGWCECEACAAMGPVTDRALTLANDVAEAVSREVGERYIGMYAYNQHSPPPERTRVHPKVIISVATSFIKGGLTVDGLIDGWTRMGAQLLGIREYYSVNTWDRDVPGAARGGNLAYLAGTITNFHAKGARFLSAESSANWGPNGLGYYLAAKMLWNSNEAGRLEALKADFFDKAFGPAREHARAFYTLIDGASKPLLSPDLVGRMYGALLRARESSADRPDVLGRLDDLVLYTRYTELYMLYTEARGEARQKAFEALIRHAWRMRGTEMVHSYALYRDLAGRDKSVTIPPEAAWQKPEPGNPWKSSVTFTNEELAGMVRDGLAANPVVDFQPVAFEGPLAPAAAALGFGGVTNPAWLRPEWQSRGNQRLHVWVDKAPTTLVFTVTGGLIEHYRDRGDARLRLTPADEVEGKAVAVGSTAPDGVPREIRLATDHAGLHYLDIADGGDSTRVAWPEGLPATVKTSLASRMDYGEGPRFFYVPKGTPAVAGFTAGFTGELRGPDGALLHEWKGEHRYFKLPVPKGADGRLWSVRGDLNKKKFHLMTVPPFLARTGAELLLPVDVIGKDAK